MAELGRISGPLLTANLLRNGVDLAFETDLLYFDVTNKRIGIKTDTPTRDLQILGDALTTNLIVDNLISNPVFEINTTGTFTWFSGNINITASNYVFVDNIRTDNLNIQNNVISTVTTNTPVEIRPAGTGDLNIFSNVNVSGNLYTPYDITLGGNLTFGSDDTDNVSFAADISSDVLPDVNNYYSLGTDAKRWALVNSYLLNGLAVDTGSINVPGISNLALRQGNIWYVSKNGADTNQGNHEHGPYATVKKALSVAQSGDTVYVYPGTYYEVLPLTVPAGVTVTGTELRTVMIAPDDTTLDKDVFLLNGETTVSNLTVKDFFYNSVNNTGYAFRFAPGATITTRSPYIQNVSVITHGSTAANYVIDGEGALGIITAILDGGVAPTTSFSDVVTGGTSAEILLSNPADPLGFNDGDAGKGALVDGTELLTTTNMASMLFHGVTMITPNVDALTMTNGVRVEWLNSFTYFANIGLYATAGTGRTTSTGTIYGAEVRSIGSANVYGNYGATADGTGTLMYLINHNFGYIGCAADTNNDTSLVIQANETVELNTGKIYYQSMDQLGNFRVGDTFHADFQTGLISINGLSTTATGYSAINFADADSETNIDASQVNTGNIRFSNHTISSLAGPVNLTSATGEVNLTQNVLVSKDMHVIGFMHVDGQLTFGNQPTDIVEFDAPVEQDLLPKQDDFYGLGTDLKRWLKTYTTESRVDDTLVISGNTITTITPNTDLRVTAATGAKVKVNSTDVEITNNLAINTVTNLDDLNVTGAIVHVGDLQRTGNVNQTGIVNQTGNITVSSTAQFDDVRINLNNVNSVATLPVVNLDLVLKASGSGTIRVPANNVVVENNVTVTGLTSVNSSQVTNTITADSFSTGDILIEDNLITTTIGNNDLQLEVAGTGKLYVPGDAVQFDQTLTVNGSSTLKSINVGASGVGNAKTITHAGNYLLTGAINQTGDRQISGTLGVTSNAYFKNIDIIGNTISTKGVTSLDLEFRAVGNGIVKALKPVNLGQTLGVTGTTYTSDILNSATITSDVFTDGDISIDNNVITTTLTNSNLSLRATDLTKNVYVPNNNVTLSHNLRVVETTALSTSIIAGTVTHYGTLVRSGDTVQTGTYQLDNISNNNNVLFTDVSIIDNRISSRTSGHDLVLRAAGTGKINVASDNVYFNQAMRVDGLLTTSTINNTTSVTTSDIFTSGNIEIDNNLIRTTLANSNLILAGNGPGGAKIEKLKFNNNVISTESNNDNILLAPVAGKLVNISSVTALKLPTGTTLNRPTGIQGDWRFNTDDNSFGGWSTARRTMGGVFSADRKTHAQAHPTANTISFVANNVPTLDLLTNKLRLNGLTVDNIQIDNNTFTAIPADTDLLIQPSGTGNVVANKIKFESNLWTNLDSSLPLVVKHTADGHLTFGGTYGIVIPSGNTASQPALPEVGDLRYNTEDQATEIWEGTKYIPITGTGDVATADIVQELGDIWSLILG